LRTIIKAGASYFLVTFAAGFILGTIRVLWLAPRVGPRTAELIEMPVMLGVMIAAAAWVVRRQTVPRRAKSRLAMGGIALVLFLVTEFAVILRLRGLSIGEYFTTLDPVTGSIYYALLVVLALLPSMVPPAIGHRRLLAFASVAVGLAALSGVIGAGYLRDISLERNRVSRGSQIAETACGRIEYASMGEGPAVLIVHGAGGGYDQGLDFSGELARAGFRAVTMSRFGYLRTPIPVDPSPAAQADAHACLLDSLKIDRAVVVGISAGAPSSMQFALRHAKRSTAMVLLVPLAYVPRTGGRPAADVPASARFMFEKAVKSDLFFWLAMKIAPSVVVRTILATPPDALAKADDEEKLRVARIMKHILPLSLRQEGLLNDAAIASSLPRYDLERIAIPTLVISIADDLYGTYASAKYTADHISKARFIGYGTGGHVWAGHHQEILAEFKAFLEATATVDLAP
jgi:2-hydroxy-6-oxonona-2,4-dienedioate hydrolase